MAISYTSSAKHASSAASQGGAANAWSNPSNAFASDNSRAICTLSTTEANNDFLCLTGFGFSLPAEAVVISVTVAIELRTSDTAGTCCGSFSNGSTGPSSVYLTKDGSSNHGTNGGQTAISSAGTIDTTATITMAGWTLSPSDVNSSNFGVRIRNKATTATVGYEIDDVIVTVNYFTGIEGGNISYVGQASSQTTSCTPPTHQVGDLFVCAAFRENATVPSLPTGWTNIANSSANTAGIRLAYKIATTTSETCTGWTNAGGLMLHVYRNANISAPIGGNAAGGASSSTVAYNTFTLTDTGNTSWVAGFAGHRSIDTTAMGTAPTGMTNRTNTAGTASNFASHDTNGTVSSWSTQSVAVGGTASGWRSYTVEIRKQPETVAILTGQAVAATSSTSGTASVTTSHSTGTMYMVCVPDGDTPSAAQIKAAQNSSGGAAIDGQSFSISSPGLKTFGATTGLTTDTPYDFWFVHNTAGGDSTAVKADYTPTASVASSSALFWAYP